MVTDEIFQSQLKNLLLVNSQGVPCLVIAANCRSLLPTEKQAEIKPIGESESLNLFTLLRTPDPGNAGVGRGKKLSVLYVHPDGQMV